MSEAMWLIGLAVFGALVAWAVNLLLLRHSGRLLVLDEPNARSSHLQPIPRGGGLGIVAALASVPVPWILWHGDYAVLWSIYPPLFAIAVVSHIDDRVTLSAWPRLCVHGLSATWLVAHCGPLERITFPTGYLPLGPLVGFIFTVLVVMWLINLYNFMDGIDGLAGGMAMLGFPAIAVILFHVGEVGGGAIAAVVAGAAGGFLLFNFPPARLFLGDVGSSVLGFLVGALIVRADLSGGAPLWAGLLVFAPFVVDASVTIGRRALRRERLWEAHRTHYYQRVVGLGWGHKPTVLIEYVLMTGCAFSVLLVLRLDGVAQWMVLGFWALVFFTLMTVVARLEKNKRLLADRGSAE